MTETPRPAPDAGSNDTLALLARRLLGELLLPGDPGYELATPWNRAVTVRPAAVVAVANADDVQRTVRFAAQSGLRVAAQRTGHGAVELCDEDVLLVHTANLDELTIDAPSRCARVGAGLIWEQVIAAAGSEGLLAPCGSAPQVGVSGYLCGGGIGPLVSSLGVSSDWVRAFDVVTGDGERRRVSAEEHPDLFWGLRGGMGTLGIVCGIELDLAPVSELYGGAVYFDGEDAADVLGHWRSWAQGLPDHATTSVALLRLPTQPDVPPPLAGRLTVAVRFASAEPAHLCEPLVASMRAVAKPLIDGIATMPVSAIGAIHADPVGPMPSIEASAVLSGISQLAIDDLLAAAGPSSDSMQAIVELRHLRGAFASPRNGAPASAFAHRAGAANLLAIGVPPPGVDLAAVAADGRRIVSALQPYATGGVLPTFEPTTDPNELRRRYDAPTYAQLCELGDRYDPDGVLRVGQVVRHHPDAKS